jgi:hypothetical protein
MSVYLTIDGGEPGDFASNKGWADACRWIDSLPVADAGQLIHLREYGWCQRAGLLARQAAAALDRHPPTDATVAATARALIDSARGAEVVTITTGVGAAAGEEFCGGPGSGRPGPCPTGHSRVAELADRVKHLPAAVAAKARAYVAGKYNQLAARYGRGYAVAIMGAGLASLPVPIPGAALLSAAPLLLAAELHRRLSGAHAQGAALTPEQLAVLGRAWVEELRRDWRP